MRSTRRIQRRAGCLKGPGRSSPAGGPQVSPAGDRGSCPAPRAGSRGPTRKLNWQAVLAELSAQQECGPLPTEMHRAACLSSSWGTHMGRSVAHEGQEHP